MTIKVAINGFGRIGRMVLRAIVEGNRKDIAVVAINDLAPPETNAHLLRFDSIHGRFPGEVTVKGDTIECGNGPIKALAVRDPAQLPWKDLGVDIALECTGLFTSKDEINGAVKRAAEQQLKGILGYTEQPNVSSDFNHDPHSSVFHMDQTKVIDGTMVAVLSWYDNEWGFSNRMIDTAVAMGKLI